MHTTQGSRKPKAPVKPPNAPTKRPKHRTAIATEHRARLIQLLKVIKDWQPAWYFLEPQDLSALGLPRMPSNIAPTVNISMIERRLQAGRYSTTAALVGDFKRIVIEVKKSWGGRPEGRNIKDASEKLLAKVQAAVLRLPDPGHNVSEIGPQDSATGINGNNINDEQFSELLDRIADVKNIHETSPLFPGDNEQPILDLGRLGKDVQQGRYGSLRDAHEVLEQIIDESEGINGLHHRITLLLNRVLVREKTPRKESTPEAETCELEPPLDEEILEGVASVVASDEPKAMSKKDIYVRQKQEEYRAGRRTDQERKPRNLVSEKIYQRTTKLEEIGSGDAEANQDGVPEQGEDDAEICETRLNMKEDTKGYTESLRDLTKDMPTMKQAYALREARRLGPNFLGRTASTTPGSRFGHSRETNGSTSQDFLLPAADTSKDYDQHAALMDLTQGEIAYMTGHHLAWADLRGDELLSCSTDMLFLVVHALGRANRGQGGVTIQFVDRRKATTMDGVRAAFHHALDLYTIFEVPRWSGWTGQHVTKLHPRKFTHEYLSHGTIRCHDSCLKQATIEDLIRDGLYEIFPPLQIPGGHKQEGLYTAQVVHRRIGYPPRGAYIGEMKPPIYSYEGCPLVKPMTIELL